MSMTLAGFYCCLGRATGERLLACLLGFVMARLVVTRLTRPPSKRATPLQTRRPAMRLSPDEIIFWQHGFFKLNATIVFTWGLMLVLAVGSKLDHAQSFHGPASARAGRIFWKSSSPASRSRLKKSACATRRNTSAFWARCSCLSPWPACAPSFPATSRRPARCRPRRRWRCACWWPCRCLASRTRGWRGYLKSYLEPTVIMLPFNIISEVSRTLALAVRLFGNMMSGAMIIGILLTHHALHLSRSS